MELILRLTHPKYSLWGLVLLLLQPAATSWGGLATEIRMVPLEVWLQQCTPSKHAKELIAEKKQLQKSLQLETWAQSLPRVSYNHSTRAYIDESAETISIGAFGNLSNPFQLWAGLESQYQRGQIEVDAAQDEQVEQGATLIEAYFHWKAQEQIYKIFSAAGPLLNPPNLENETALSNDALESFLTLSNLIMIRDSSKRESEFYTGFFSSCSPAKNSQQEVILQPVSISELEKIALKLSSAESASRRCASSRNYDSARRLEQISLWTPSILYSLNYPIKTNRNVSYDLTIGLQLSIPLGTLSNDSSTELACELRANKQKQKLSQLVSEAIAAHKVLSSFQALKTKLEESLHTQTKVSQQGLVHQPSFLTNLRRYYDLETQIARLNATIYTSKHRGDTL